MQVKAIQTRYAGHHFRSRLEARWAVLFDTAGIEWEYELEGFELPSGRYLPDFWLPQVMMWAEVKPNRLTGPEFQKCRELAIGTGFDVLLLDGKPERRYYSAITVMRPGCQTEIETPSAMRGVPYITHYDILEPHRYWECESRFYWQDRGKFLAASAYSRPPRYWTDDDWIGECEYASECINKANSARFEYGDNP